MKRQVLEILDNAPPDHFDPKVKQHLAEVKRRIGKLGDRIDDLGRLDEASGEVFVDENSLRKLLRDVSARKTPSSTACVSFRITSSYVASPG